MNRDVFQAIADPTRRAILVLIATQAMTPNSLAEEVNMSRQAISKHVRILNECNLLNSQKEGREIYYSLKVDKMKEIDEWIRHFRVIWEKRFEALDDLLKKMN